MAWTGPTAAFFAAIALMLVAMTIWELRSPTVLRKGRLPMLTTRGDRLFISLLWAAFLHLFALGTGWFGVGQATFAAAVSLLLILWQG
jgi:predicted small integral membrane protein